MTPLHLHKDLIKMNMKIKMNTKIKSKRRTMIKGEMRMMGIREKDHYIQECATMFKEITPSTTYLVITKNGNH
jgi:ribosomal protein S20